MDSARFYETKIRKKGNIDCSHYYLFDTDWNRKQLIVFCNHCGRKKIVKLKEKK